MNNCTGENFFTTCKAFLWKFYLNFFRRFADQLCQLWNIWKLSHNNFLILRNLWIWYNVNIVDTTKKSDNFGFLDLIFLLACSVKSVSREFMNSSHGTSGLSLWTIQSFRHISILMIGIWWIDDLMILWFDDWVEPYFKKTSSVAGMAFLAKKLAENLA